MKDQTKIIAALLVGAAAGAVLGVLLAPDSGDETRKEITDFFAELVEATKEKAQAKANGIKDYSNSVYNNAKSKFNGVVNGVSDYSDDAVENAKAKAKDLADHAKNHANDAVDHAKTKVKSTSNDVNDAIQSA